MLTGVGCYTYLKQKIDQPLSRYLQPDRTNRLIRDSFYRAVENKLDRPVDQQIYDELGALRKVGKVYTPVANTIGLAAAMILTMGNPGGLSPTISIQTVMPHNLQPGSIVTVLNILGWTYTFGSFNGTWTVVTTNSPTTFTYVATGAQTSAGSYSNPMGGYAYNTTGTILDYDHLTTVKAKFNEPITKPGQLTAVAITGVSIAAQMVVTAPGHNRRVGEWVTIASVQGTAPLTTNINAVLQIIEIPTADTFKVNASGVGGTYISGGTINSSHYNYCVDLKSDEKIAVFGDPSYLYPRVEQAQKTLKFLADKLGTRVCSEITIDYICLPAIEIDVRDDYADLELYYSAKFLYFLLDVVAQNFSGQAKDQQLFQTETMAINAHP